MGATGTEGLWMGQCTRAGLCVWELRVVTLGTEISPSLSFLLCKMEITAPPGGNNLTGTSLRLWGVLQVL